MAHDTEKSEVRYVGQNYNNYCNFLQIFEKVGPMPRYNLAAKADTEFVYYVNRRKVVFFWLFGKYDDFFLLIIYTKNLFIMKPIFALKNLKMTLLITVFKINWYR